jgi:predicted transcriptional regulator
MKPRLNCYFSDDVMRRLDLLARDRKSNKSAVVSKAVQIYLDPERDPTSDAALLRRLDRFGKVQERIERDTTIAIEILALFVRYYLTITPPLPSSDQDGARALGRERFEMFVAQIGRRIAGGSKLITEVLETVRRESPDLFSTDIDEFEKPRKKPPGGDETRSAGMNRASGSNGSASDDSHDREENDE